MIRRLFTIASALSLLIAILLSIVITWGTISRTEFVWAKGDVLHQLVIGGNTVTWVQIDGWPRDEPVVRLNRDKGIVFRIPRWSTGEQWDDWFCAGSSRTAIIGSVDPWGHESPTTPGNMTAVWLMTRRCAVISSLLPLMWGIWRLRKRRGQTRGFDVEPIGK